MRILIKALVLFIIVLLLGLRTIAAITELSVARGGKLQGVKQFLKDTDGNPLEHTLTGSCISAPQGGSTSHLIVDNIVSRGNGWYTFDITINIAATLGDYQIRFYDNTVQIENGNPPPTWLSTPLSTILTIHVKYISIKGVSFRNGNTPGHPVWNINPDLEYGSTSNPYEWLCGASNNPGAYTRSTGQKYIKVKVLGPADGTGIRVRAYGDLGGIGFQVVSFNSEGVTEVQFQTGYSVPTFVSRLNVGWTWQYSTDGGTTWYDTNATTHKLYFTDNNPLTVSAHEYWQLYDIGCTAGGATVFSGIWGLFRGLSITAPGTGSVYRYWPTTSETNGFVRGLLITKSGTCGAFARFMQDLLAIQGISCTIQGIWPPTNFDGISVLSTTPAQGGIPAQRYFEDHAIIKYNNQYFDPSYGTPGSDTGYADIAPWEDTNINAFLKIIEGTTVEFENPEGQQTSTSPP
jgi:hypothetical protein